MTPVLPDRAILEELATANRILFQQGVVDGFGHVSMRHPEHPDHFLLARSMAPVMVTPDDIMLFDPDSEPTSGDKRRPYLERFIHGEIYRIRPDVGAVVHSHSPSVVPFSIVPTVTLRPVFHMSGFLGKGAPVFEIRCCAGDRTDMLICNRKLGAALALSLGQESTVLMRGHGSTVVGETLRQVVFRAIYTEVNARLQGDALRLGEPTYLSPGEAAASTETNNGQLNRSWDMWAAQAAGSLV